MARVKIKKLPKALSGLEIKMQPGLYGTNGNRQFTLSTQVNSQKFAQQPTEVRGTLQPVPRNEANLEAEKGETAVVNIDGMPAHFKIGGKRHSQGGTPLSLPDNSFIFSDTAKMKIKDPNILAQFGMSTKKGGYTPAEIAKKYDINQFRKVLADPNSEDVERKTAELMISNYNMKLAKLGLAQESMKGFPQGIPVMAMPYVMANNVNPADYFPTEAQEDEPDADTGEARYGGNMIAQFPTKAHGGMHFAGYPYYQKGAEVKPSIYDVLDNMERNLLGSIQEQRSKGRPIEKSILDAYSGYEKLRKKYGTSPVKAAPAQEEMSWVNAEGTPITDPRQGATGYWDRVMQNWSSQPDIYNIDPEQLDKISKQKGYSNIEVPTKKGKAAKEIVSTLNPYNAEGVLDYAGNILSASLKGVNAGLTGNLETPGITYLRTNPGNEGTALLIDVVSDPLTYVGPKGFQYGAKGIYKGAQKVLPYAKDLAEFTIKYGKQAGKYLAENLPRLGSYISKKAIEGLKSEVVQNLAVSGISRAAGYDSYKKANEEFTGGNAKVKALQAEIDKLKKEPYNAAPKTLPSDATSVLVKEVPKKDTAEVTPVQGDW
jgi:hypothetical protein